MPIPLTYPGVYIEEIPSGVRTITGVSTSTTAFLGRAQKGPTNKPVLIHSYGDYERIYGGLWYLSTMSYAVQQFFQNGGTDAVIVRLVKDATSTQFVEPLLMRAKYEGTWGDNLQISINYETKDGADPALFNIIVELTDPEVFTDAAKTVKKVIQKESFMNVTVNPNDTRYIGKVLSEQSELVELAYSSLEDLPTDRPSETENPVLPSEPGNDGIDLGSAEYLGSELEKTGIFALEETDIFNLLCIPPFTFLETGDVTVEVWEKAQEYCKRKRAFLIMDPPISWLRPSVAADNLDKFRGGPNASHSAMYFPRVMLADPLQENRLEDFSPCGILAGIYARTDAQRGVWKAPAGTEAGLSGVRELIVKLTDKENGDLNQLGLNCLRNFPVYGNIVWGTRTLDGADRIASEWKYIPIRRLALFIEESLFRGTQWVVFEPNDEPLWAQIRLNVGAFMHSLFRQGAFQGRSPREAYFVKCDGETTTQNDRDKGIVNILVGFAPLKPAEFVVIKIQQIAGEIET